MKKVIFDIEVYPNLFTIVFYDVVLMDYVEFEISDRKNEQKKLLEYLQEDVYYVGYNCIAYDGPILEFIKEKKGRATNKEIYELSQKLVDSDERGPYPPHSLSYNYIDLFKVWHYDRPERYTSLKWLEFTLRQLNIVDLPYPHDKPIPVGNINNVIKYNKNDVAVTTEFFHISQEAIQMREELGVTYSESFLNKSDASIGESIFLSILPEALGISKKELSSLRSPRTVIDFNEIILPYVKFKSPEFQNTLDHFRNKKVFAQRGENMVLKGVFNFTQNFGGIDYDFGIGGVHACVDAGIYIPGDDEILVDIDVKSFYPNLGIRNRLKPEHLPDKFCDIYEELFEKRKTYPKSNPLNYAFKILLNSAYGKSNSAYSFLYDPKYTCAITVNGQLSICMLAEMIAPLGKILQANTDGVTIAIKKSSKRALYNLCVEWEKTTGLELEYATYSKMIIRDVNNYLAVYDNGSYKAKGVFVTRDQMVKGGEWHKNHSSTIIADALHEYYMNGIPVETTINSATNIFDFLICTKKKRNFVHILAYPDKYGRVNIDRLSDRVFRYYISHSGKTLYKAYDSLKFEGVNVGALVSDAMKLKTNNILMYTDLDRQYYIDETLKIINSIQ